MAKKTDLAAKLARAIFTAPSHGTTAQVLRIEFKARSIDGGEYGLGGFNEGALAEHLRTALSDLNVVLQKDTHAHKE